MRILGDERNSAASVTLTKGIHTKLSLRTFSVYFVPRPQLKTECHKLLALRI
jgi:hypothetical protein